jgi:hypothetical protein
MTTWGENVVGLEGLNLTYIFNVPNNCGLVTPKELPSHAFSHYHFYNLRNQLMN